MSDDRLTAEELEQIEETRRQRDERARVAEAKQAQELQRRADAREAARGEIERRRAATETHKTEALQQLTEKRLQREAERATQEASVRARSLALTQELAAAKTALTEAQIRVARARAFNEPGLKEARAAVTRWRREIEELAAALDVLDAELARLQPNIQFGRHKRVG